MQLLQAYVEKRGGKRIVHKILVANNGLAAVRFIRRLREVRPALRPPTLIPRRPSTSFSPPMCHPSEVPLPLETLPAASCALPAAP
jgi:hypothetical protein